MKRLLTEASLIMKPEGQADGLLPSVKPIDGSGDFTFSRGSNLAATRVNQAGLIEKGRENLLKYSEDLTKSQWVNVRTTDISGQAGYDGTSNAYKVIPTTDNNTHRLDYVDTWSTSQVYTFSFYAKASGYDTIDVFVGGTSIGGTYGRFNLSTGTASNVGSSISTSMEDLGSGWYRCQVAQVSGSATRINIGVNDGTTQYYVGDGTSGVLIQHPQLDRGLVATPYIPTTTTTAKAGVLEDAPRLDYSGGATEPSLLLEPQRTNLMTNSEYTGAYSKSNITATSNQAVSPEGVENATEVKTTSTGQCHMRAAFTAATGNYVGSVFVKKQDFDYIYMEMGGAYAWFNINTGTLGNGNNYGSDWTYVDHSIEDYGNGWYRCALVGNCLTAGAYTFRSIQPVLYNNTYNSTLSGGSTYWYGSQLEAATYPTSYIPTNGSAVTRSADSCSVAGVSDVIGQSEGTLFVEADLTDVESTTTRGIAELNDGGTLNRITLFRNSNGTIRLFVRNGGTAQMDETFATPPSGVTKIAIGYALNNIVLYVNGTQVASDTSASIPACSELDLGQMEGNLTKALGDALNQALVFPTRLTNAELAALTTL